MKTWHEDAPCICGSTISPIRSRSRATPISPRCFNRTCPSWCNIRASTRAAPKLRYSRQSPTRRAEQRATGTFVAPRTKGRAMNEDVLNTSVRRFLKKVGITSQREIEKAVRDAVAGGRLEGNEALPAKRTLTVGDVGIALEIDGAIELE